MEYRGEQYSVILTPSQGAQVIGHVAELLDHLGSVENRPWQDHPSG